MANTMTLDQVRDWLRAEAKTTNLVAVEARFNLFADAIDAAIRDRDELRGRLDSALGDRIREFRRTNDESRRADKAEAELAALKRTLWQILTH